ncbi:sigma-70 family RNA polymerase sigma factor [Chloroflexi bacterium TSY]|nr:sigma-70 family RNA polymerase sigma factor [Chloroflexi bacterium TSY]
MSYDFGNAQFAGSSLRYGSQRSYEYLPRTGQQRSLPQVRQTAVAVLDMQSAIQAARGGEEWAFTYLADYYRGAAERVAQHILRTEEAAADAVQDALIKVYRAMPRFHDGNFRSWLLRIVTNTCYDHLRRQKRRIAVSLDELTENAGDDILTSPNAGVDDPEAVALHSESMRLLLDTIDELSPWHRNVVLLVDVHGYDYAEAADLLELPLGTIKSRLSRARSALRDRLLAAGLVPAQILERSAL